MLQAQKSLLAAINLCATLSGLDDNEIALELEIQPAQWSRIKAGQAHMPPDKIGALMDLCGNEAPLLWLARDRGYGLVLLKSEAERQRDEALEQAARTQMENEALLKALKALGGGR
jgi:hypothetical protein